MKGRKDIHSLELDQVSFAFENSQPVFANMSRVLPTARAVWVRSGGSRGKSTLLKILAGLLTPQSGRYLINGENANEMSFEEFLKYRLNIGYGFDMGGLLNNKTIFENLCLPLLYHKMVSPVDAYARADSVIDFFSLQAVRDQRPFSVPGSQRKLSCVTRAFVHWPQVVFLDDPMIGLTQDNLNDLMHYVEESYALRGLKQVFFTSERAEFAQKFNAEEMMISEDWFKLKSVA